MSSQDQTLKKDDISFTDDVIELQNQNGFETVKLDQSSKIVYEGGSDAESLIAAVVDEELNNTSGGPAGADLDPATAFMSQIPPNWDKAKLHGEANLVLDSSKTQLDMQNPDSFCPCCQLPYPGEDAYLEMSISNFELGFLGPGFPLFFILMQQLCLYLFCLCLIYFLPCAMAITSALDELEGEEFFIESSWAMFSYGAFVAGTGDDGIANIDYQQRQTYINTLAWFFMASVIFSFFFFIWMRSKLYDYAEQLNAASLTPADYCVQVIGCELEDAGNADSIFNEVKEVMQDRFGLGEKVQYVNAAYNISDFYALSAKFNEINGQISLVEFYIAEQKKEKPDYNEDAYRADMALKKVPRGFPKRKGNKEKDEDGNEKKSFLPSCSKVPINIDEARNQSKELDASIKELEEANLDERFLGTIFIVFDRPSDASRIIAQQGSWALKFVLKIICCCCTGCFPKGFFWSYVRAPEPSDIFWENLGIPSYERLGRSMVSLAGTSCLLVACIFVIRAVKLAQIGRMEADAELNLSQSEQRMSTFLSILCSLAISMVNESLINIIRRFTDYEKHKTITRINVSVATKLTIARFLNTSVILVLVNKDTKNWFEGGSVAYDATYLMLIMAFQNPIFYALNIGGRMKKRSIEKQIAKGDKCLFTQQKANQMCEGPTLDVSNIISKYFTLIMTCIFYSPIIPVAIPIAFGGSVMSYFTYKYMLLRVHKMPEMFGDIMATFFASLMPIVLMVWAIAYTVFITEINRAYAEDFNRAYTADKLGLNETDVADSTGVIKATNIVDTDLSENDQSGGISMGAIILTICCCLCPVRSLIYYFRKEVAEEQNTAYKEIALSFPSDYDKENPLTMQKGQLRLLDLQIAKAKAEGNAEMEAQLQGSRTQVSAAGQSLVGQMQQYTNMSQARTVAFNQSFTPMVMVQQPMMMNGFAMQQQQMAMQQQMMVMQQQRQQMVHMNAQRMGVQMPMAMPMMPAMPMARPGMPMQPGMMMQRPAMPAMPMMQPGMMPMRPGMPMMPQMPRPGMPMMQPGMMPQMPRPGMPMMQPGMMPMRPGMPMPMQPGMMMPGGMTQQTTVTQTFV